MLVICLIAQVSAENDEESDVCDKEGSISNSTSVIDMLNSSQQFSGPHMNGSLLNNHQLLNSCAPSPPLEVNIDGKDRTNPGMYESPVSPLHGVFGGSSDSPSGYDQVEYGYFSSIDQN